MINEFSTTISYDKVRIIILEYFKKEENIDLDYIGINYFKDYLMDRKNPQSCFIMKNELGETRFNVPKDDILKLLKLYLSKMSMNLLDVNFSDRGVEIKYSIKLKINDIEEENNKQSGVKSR